MRDVFLGAGNDQYGAVTFNGATLDFDGSSGRAGNVFGGAGNDVMLGGAFDDKFYGGSDNDTLDGSGGRDQLFGGNGDDSLSGGTGNDKLFGGAGSDVLDGGTGNDSLSGGNDSDILLGGSGNDTANGGNGDDLIFGDEGNDRLLGAAGNDTIEGGAGRDTMFGGTGDDVFVFSRNDGRDEIRDFTAGDRIDLSLPFIDESAYTTITENTTFFGNRAEINLSAVFNAFPSGGSMDSGTVLTLHNVTLEDLTSDAFGFVEDVLVIG